MKEPANNKHKNSTKCFVPKKCSVILERRNLKRLKEKYSDMDTSSVSRPPQKKCYVVLDLMNISQQINDRNEGNIFKSKDYSLGIQSDCSESEEKNDKTVDEDAEINR